MHEIKKYQMHRSSSLFCFHMWGVKMTATNKSEFSNVLKVKCFNVHYVRKKIKNENNCAMLNLLYCHLLQYLVFIIPNVKIIFIF